ncbi:Glu-tRNA(Gln) amidotransferase subunit GatE [Candidatus Pacearchaeota archaeon]|nr:Glu-tRNA(Gln) amidotransferase subunit GatE [Candidatus Pacearchaeota archaeon]
MSETQIKSGLEIHQQLDTGKLFCSCPSILRKDNPDYKIERKLHIIAGESGEIDSAVKHEAAKEKTFVYECYRDNDCLVDLDEEPPHMINEEALKIAIQISLLLNCEIIQNTQVMRKTVIDGSNVSGFQRTVLIAKNGYVETSFGKVGIKSLLLEEDAARPSNSDEDSERENVKVYKLDRLGIPLVEIATNPDIKNPEQAKEAALHIGEILRACKVKRGLGTIRQDVNVSVSVDGKWGERVEIKGVQEPDLIIKTIETETERQKKLVKKNESKSEVRKANEDGTTSFMRPMPGEARMYPETDLPLLYISRDEINEAKKTLPRLRSEIKDDLRKHGLNEELVKLLSDSGKMNDFQELMQVYSKADVVAKILTLWMQDISVKLKKKIEEINDKLTIDIIETILQAVNDKKISENDIYDIMKDIAGGKRVEEAIKREKIENMDEEIMKIIKEKPGLSENAYMGLIMAKFKGKVNGKEVMLAIKRVIGK